MNEREYQLWKEAYIRVLMEKCKNPSSASAKLAADTAVAEFRQSMSLFERDSKVDVTAHGGAEWLREIR